MRIYKDDTTQLKFEEFVDKMVTGNEILLIEECMDKFEKNPNLTAEELEYSFYGQCSTYFEVTYALELMSE